MRKKQLNVFLTTILMVASMSVYALNKVDGVYQIGTAADLEEFAVLVNGGEVNANAVLTADIDKGTENYRIGCDGQDYQGTFDGNGHTITYNMTFDEDGASLFRNVGIQGIIQNLKVQGIINTNSSFAGSIAGWNRGRIIGCYADVTINSSKEGIANHGGLVGRCYFGAVIENCLVKVAIKGEKSQICGGVIGWTSDRINIMNTLVVSEGTILDNSNGYSCNIACCPSINPITVVTKNVYVVNPISNDYGRDGNKYTFYENEEGIANGELAFLLNGKQSGLNRFYQVIGTDPMPTPLMNEGGRIYVTAPEFRCDGLPLGNTTFSNTYTSDPVIPAHHFVEGWCTVCGNMDEDFVTPVNGWLEISSGAQLKWWSVYASIHEDCKARLTADINMEGYCEGYTPPQIFTGQFDGQGHVISNFIIESSSDYQGLIGIIGNGAFIKNLVLDKTCSITGNAFCGVIGGTNGSGDIYIDRVGNEGTVATYYQNAAGILGIDMQGSMNLHITNCYVTGTIDGGRESGAICGYSNTNSEVINCWSTATIPQYSIYSSDSFTRGPAKVTNCYEAAIEGVDATKQQHINPIAEDRRVNPITLEEVANGALCYRLNESRQGGGNFYQVIGTDSRPLPFAKEGGKVYCQGNSVYSNTPPVDQEGTWTDANGTEWYFTTNEGNATITNRGFNNDNIPSISGTIPAELTIPSTVYIGETPYSVNAIGDCAFYNCSSLTSITIPDGVTDIRGGAFRGCSNLTSITIPDGVTSIENYLFSGCSSLSSVTIPEGISFIGKWAFSGCSSLTSINIPDGITAIEYYAFNGCSSLTTINIPEGVTSIGSGAFYNCFGLTSIIIPKSVTAIWNGAFEGCHGLTTINIPENVSTIISSAFSGCDGLASIVVSDANTIYDSRNDCNAIIETASNKLIRGCVNTVIPEDITSIEMYAFDGCKGQTSLNVPESVTNIGSYAFMDCNILTSINIPETMTTIGDRTFYRCSRMTSVNIPNSITSIEYGAFWGCINLESITIPEGVTSIGEYAFSGCSSLKSVIVGMQTPIDLSMNSNTFGNYSNATLYVPTGSKAAYQSADVWKDFKEIMEYNYVDGSQDPPVSEFNAALAAITDGSYYLTTDVNGTKYYVTQNGHLTNDEESAYVFAISKVNASGAVSPLFDVAFLIDPGNGVHFSNPTPLLDGKAYLHLGFFYQDDHNNRNDWDRQVLFLNETGKFAIRSSNTPYDENSWLDAGRTFWTWEVGTDNSIIPCYSYEPAYIWTLEEAGAKEGFWTDANGTEWYFTISGSKATISNRGWDNSGHIPSISGTIPNELTIPSTVYIGETPYLVNAIGDCAFYNCSCLTSITIPEEVTSIGWSAFYGCSSLTSITIPESVTSIARGAFSYCSGLTSITIPKSVTFIEGDLFTGCDNLTSITVEEGNSVYDSRNGCNAIIKTASNTLISGCRNTIIPESVVSIGDIAFQSRYILTSITIPDGVASIGDYAFNCCDGLTSITIPNSVKTIGSGAFRICDNLTSIVVNEGNTVYDSRNGCNAIIESASNTLISGCKNTIIPDGVTSIGSEAFYCCYSLTSINIPESVTSIGESSFVGCISLSSITIPESVTVIGERSFAGCSKLNTVTVNAVTPPACADDAFSNIADNCTLKVPYGTGDAYAAADGWKNFNEIIECDPEGTDISRLDNAIYIEPFAAKVGANTQMEICLKNAETATAYVFDLVLPEGITVATNDNDKYIDELSDRHEDHTRTINYKGENTYSLSTLSGNSEELTGNDGPIRLVTIAVPDNMAGGHYAIDIKNASYSKPDGTLVSLPDTRAVVTVEDYVLGDVNGNGGVDIGDAVSIVNYLVGKDSSNFVAKAADTNKNGQIDIGDAVTIVNLLVGKITSLTREFNIIWDEKEPE